MAHHTHRWKLIWCLPMGVHDAGGWLPVVFAVQCACGVGGIYHGEESTRLQQRRVHEGDRP